MRQTCIGATGSSIHARLPVFPTHAWVAAFLLWLMFGLVQPASASNHELTYRRFVTRQANFQPSPGLALGSAATDSALPVASAPNLYSETYWTAFADLDLTTLRNAAQTDAEARFAEAMSLLAEGNVG